MDQFLRCAYRSFRSARSQWKDMLVELNLLKITDIYGYTYCGKDIYKVQEDNLLFVSLDPAYLDDFHLVSAKVVKYWNIVHKLDYSKLWSPQDAISLGVYVFNEELYEEYLHYAEIQKERFRREAIFFEVLEEVIGGLTSREAESINHWSEAMERVKKLADVYYGVNVEKLKRDIENNLRKAQKGKKAEKIKVEFVKTSKRVGLWQRLKGWARRIYSRLVHERSWNIPMKPAPELVKKRANVQRNI